MEPLQKKSGDTDFFHNIKMAGFDFDDTLVDEQYAIKRRWQKVLEEYAMPELKQEFFKVYEKRGPVYRFHLDETLHNLHKGRLKNEILLKLRQTWDDELLCDGALELIAMLKQKGIAVGIITNGRQDYQEGRIKKAGIFHLMDFIFYGRGIKEQKPDEATLKRLETLFSASSLTGRGEFCFIGNDFQYDIEGMLGWGAKACWITKESVMPGIKGLMKAENINTLLAQWKKAL